MRQLMFKLDEELRGRLIECAWKSRMNKSEFIRHAIEKLCKEIENAGADSNRRS